MNEFIDDFSVDEAKMHEEIVKWKKEFKKNIYRKEDNSKNLKNVSFISMIIAIISLIALVIGSISVLMVTDDNVIFFIILATSLMLLVISGMTWICTRALMRSKISRNVKDSLENNGFNEYQKWFSNAFQHENLSNDYKALFATDYHGIKSLVNIYKYRPTGSPVGVTETYDIMGGTIFNNPFNLSCGIFQSMIHTGRSTHYVHEYMPVFQIKTSQFLDVDVLVTNSKNFSGYSKNDLLFENKEFREKYFVKTKDHMEALMLFTPLVQEKWVKLLKSSPKFQMHIRKGMITILFQGFVEHGVKNFGSTTRSFMNILHLYQKTPFEKVFLKNLEKNIMDDLKSFCALVNLVFAISYFQWENLAITEKA